MIVNVPTSPESLNFRALVAEGTAPRTPIVMGFVWTSAISNLVKAYRPELRRRASFRGSTTASVKFANTTRYTIHPSLRALSLAARLERGTQTARRRA
jgi:hypothetical protein